MFAWNGWYHVNGNTYGTWLRGDPRGWRARKHREHCEGDYKNPPSRGMYDDLLKLSRQRLECNPVLLDWNAIVVAGQSLVEKLIDKSVEVIAFSLDKRHYHILARYPSTDVRWWVGLAKKHAFHELNALGRKGPLWAKRNRVLPLRDRRHQENTFEYILDHAYRGAWVWHWRVGTPWRKSINK